MNKVKVSCAAAALMLSTGPAFAGTATATLSVNATIVASCTSLSTNALSFGNVTSWNSGVTATGSVAVVCQPGTPYSVDLDNGLGFQVLAGVRTLNGPGGNLIAYNIFTDAAHTTLWGTGLSGGTSVSGSGTGGTQVLTTYGLAIPGGTPTLGAYSDTVTVTLNF